MTSLLSGYLFNNCIGGWAADVHVGEWRRVVVRNKCLLGTVPYRSSEGSCSPEAISYTIRSLVEKVCYTSSVYCVAYQQAIAAIHFVLDDTLM